VTDTDDLATAIREFEATLPGWWWSVGSCFISRDASCGPQRYGPDGDLLDLKLFDDGFHHDDREGDVAGSLREVMRQALAARASHRQGRDAP
jgi:hypothetical protein